MANQADRPTRRTVLTATGAGGLAMALGTLALTGRGVALPHRQQITGTLPDIQFDIAARIGAPRRLDDGAGPVRVQLPPVHTVFTTATLHRTPTRKDQQALQEALATIEANYPFSPEGVMLFIAYGLSYFTRLGHGITSEHMPRLKADPSRYVLEDAVPGPTDVPNVKKARFNVPVRIEHNDLLITLRSDNAASLTDVLAWLGGSNRLNGRTEKSPAILDGLATVTSSRTHSVQIGLPRKLAQQAGVSYAASISPDSPLWMGFVDQQVSGSGPAPICTFAGNHSARLTTAKPGDYFDNGSIQHLSHVIEDLEQFYHQANQYEGEESYIERVQYVFRSNPVPAVGRGDQLSSGGGPAFIDNTYQGTRDAEANAKGSGTFNNEHRMGHLCAVQRSARATDGTPMHIRMDGPGLDSLDVPNGKPEPKLHFTIFVPTADFFRQLRVSQAALDLTHKYGVAAQNNGVERFITTTRRQNFLIPPRRHRAFPLAELA